MRGPAVIAVASTDAGHRRKLVALNTGHEFGYGDLPKQVVAFSIKCETESVKAWEAKDGIVHLPEAAGAR